MQLLATLVWILLTLLLVAGLGRLANRLDDVEAQLGLQQSKSDVLTDKLHDLDRHIHHQGGVHHD